MYQWGVNLNDMPWKLYKLQGERALFLWGYFAKRDNTVCWFKWRRLLAHTQGSAAQLDAQKGSCEYTLAMNTHAHTFASVWCISSESSSWFALFFELSNRLRSYLWVSPRRWRWKFPKVKRSVRKCIGTQKHERLFSGFLAAPCGVLKTR